MARSEVVEYTHEFDGESSTSIRHVWYNENTHALTVGFRSGGTYTYDDVTPGLFADFYAADSLGQYFQRRFRQSGQVWPGRKHDESRTRFVKVDAEPRDLHPDVDAIKTIKLTTGRGKTYKLRYEFSGEAEMEVRADDVDEAIRLFVNAMHEKGFTVKVKGYYTPLDD